MSNSKPFISYDMIFNITTDAAGNSETTIVKPAIYSENTRSVVSLLRNLSTAITNNPDSTTDTNMLNTLENSLVKSTEIFTSDYKNFSEEVYKNLITKIKDIKTQTESSGSEYKLNSKFLSKSVSNYYDAVDYNKFLYDNIVSASSEDLVNQGIEDISEKVSSNKGIIFLKDGKLLSGKTKLGSKKIEDIRRKLKSGSKRQSGSMIITSETGSYLDISSSNSQIIIKIYDSMGNLLNTVTVSISDNGTTTITNENDYYLSFYQTDGTYIVTNSYNDETATIDKLDDGFQITTSQSNSITVSDSGDDTYNLSISYDGATYTGLITTGNNEVTLSNQDQTEYIKLSRYLNTITYSYVYGGQSSEGTYTITIEPNVPEPTGAGVKILLVLSFISRIYFNSSSLVNAMLPHFPSASKTSAEISSSGNVLRNENSLSLVTLADQIKEIESVLKKSYDNDSTLARGIHLLTSAVGSYDKNWGSNKEKNQDNLNYEFEDSASTSLYFPTSENAISKDLTIPNITDNVNIGALDAQLADIQTKLLQQRNNTRKSGRNTLGQNRNTLSSKRNRSGKLSSDEINTVKKGVETAISQLKEELAELTNNYTSKVDSGLATSNDTGVYMSESTALKSKIGAYENELGRINALPRSRTRTTTSEPGPIRTGIKNLLGGRPYTDSISSEQKQTLKSRLSEMSVNTPNLDLNSVYEGYLSNINVVSSSTCANKSINVNCSGILNDSPFSVAYSLSSEQFTQYSSNVFSSLDGMSQEISNEKFNEYLVYIFLFLGLLVNNALNEGIEVEQVESGQIIQMLSSFNATDYSTSIFSQEALTATPDSSAIYQIVSNTKIIDAIFNNSEIAKESARTITINTGTNTTFRDVIGYGNQYF